MATGRVPTTANSPLTAKGDLFTYSTAPARLAVGLDGEQIVADSSTSTGLRYNANFAAGKNAIINGDLRINQRNFTSNTANASFNFDRFSQLNSGGTVTVTPQTFTLGAAPVAGYEATNFVRMVTASQSAAGDFAIMQYKVEDVRSFANQTVTISFWAKAASGTPKMTIEADQTFGFGGSASVLTTFGTVTLSTSWTRYTVTGTIPSISGKTIGTSNSLILYYWVSAGTTYAARTNSMGVQNNTFDLWGFQLEAGSVATAFQTATGTLQGELAACQRYYYRTVADGVYTQFGNGSAKNGTQAQVMVPFPVTMRVGPTALTYGSLVLFDGGTIFGSLTVTLNYSGRSVGAVDCTTPSGLTQFRSYFLLSDNTTAGFIAFSAEL